MAYLATYLTALGLQDLALPDNSGLAFFWPAAGVAALWMLSGSTRRRVVLDGSLLVLGTISLDVAFGVDLVPAGLFALANLVAGVTFRSTCSKLEGRAFWGRLRRRVAGPRDLWGIGLAVAAAALASALPGLLAVLLESHSLTWGMTALWVVRSSCSTFIVVAAVLGLLTAALRAHAGRGLSAVLTPTPRRFWSVELTLLAAISTFSAVVLFGSSRALPIAFGMIVTSTWIGSRFSPAVGGVYAAAVGTLATLCTQAGRGPFATIDDVSTRAIIVQVYALVTTVIVLLLSLGATERAALLARVVRSEARATSRADLVDAVTTVMTDGLVVVDGTGRILLSNPAAQVLAGIAPGNPQLGSLAEHGFVQPDGSAPPDVESPRARALRGEVVPPTDLVRINPQTGQQTILSISAMPLHQADPDAEAVAVLVLRDVTKVRTSRRELENFAGVVAHDLKTPLAGVISWAEILEEQLSGTGRLETGRSEGADLTTSVQRIRSSANRMSVLISDLLAYTQAQHAELSVQPVDLDEMVDQITRELRETHHLEVPVVEHETLGVVLADQTLVRQLMVNVMGNAIKYVAPGVRPHLVIGSARAEDMLEIWVSDNGVGIPKKDLGRVFDSFFRASRTRDYPGTGLGLAICARTVERHGGRISARKGLDGHGTTMIFTLPLGPDRAPVEDLPELEPATATS